MPLVCIYTCVICILGEQAQVIRIPPALHEQVLLQKQKETITVAPMMDGSNVQQMSQLYAQLYDLKWWLAPVYHQPALHHRMARMAMEHAMEQHTSVISMHSIHTVFVGSLFELSMGRCGLSEHHAHLTKMPFDKVYYHHTSATVSHYLTIQIMFCQGDGTILGAQIVAHYSLQSTVQCITHVLAAMVDKCSTIYDLQQVRT